MDGFKGALVVTPAYGRDYQEEWDARCAWFGGADFKVVNGPYVSVRDAPHLRAEGYPCVVVLYAGGSRRALVGVSRRAELDHAVQASRVRAEAARRGFAGAVSRARDRD